jgi:hypothetical protein
LDPTNYIDLVQAIATALADATEDYSVRTMGVWDHQFIPTIAPTIRSSSPGLDGTGVDLLAFHVFDDLERLSVIARDGHRVLLSDHQRLVAPDLRSLWPSIFNTHLDDDQSAFLSGLVAISLNAEDGVAPRDVEMNDVFARLGWQTDAMKSVALFNALKDRNMLAGLLTMGPHFSHMRPTYSGVVRITQEEPTAVRQLVEGLIPDWETASVEFKLELSLDQDTGKAELAKDLNALATTKTSDKQRYLIVGFHPKTHLFTRSLDPRVTQDRLEQILNAHTTGSPPTRLYRANWPGGVIGVIVVAREAINVPYRLRPETASRFFGGREVFVRHGSQVEPPTPAEIESLTAEGKRAQAETP